jgi:uncharacterized membrane protein
MSTSAPALPSTGRTEAFSDGVIAIAITLLILEVKVPAPSAQGLWRDLAHQWPSYAAYGVSFVVIGIMWVNHHAMFQRIASVDRTVLFLNLGLLMGIAFLPFPTALLAAYLRSGRDAHAAAAVYSCNMVAIGLGFLFLWRYLVRHPTVRAPGFTEAQARAALHRTTFGPIVYGLTIPLAFVSPYLCLALYAFLAIFFAMRGRAQAAEERSDAT